MKNDDYIVTSVNYCDGLGRCFRFVCIYAFEVVFLCATVFFGEYLVKLAVQLRLRSWFSYLILNVSRSYIMVLMFAH